MSIKVLIIDDSAVVRQTMTEILSSDPEIQVIGTASDPLFAVRKIKEDRPDVITLDVEMPRMDGLTFLRRINEMSNPIPVVICSSKVEAGSEIHRYMLELSDEARKITMDLNSKFYESYILRYLRNSFL